MLIDLYLWLRVKFSAPEHVFYWKKGAAAWLLKSEHDLTIIKNHAYFVRVLRSFILPFFLMWKSLFSHRSMYQNSYRSCLNCTHRAIETTFPPVNVSKLPVINYLGGSPVIRVWNQKVCFFCGLRFKSCGCSYEGHWRLTWSFTLEPVKLVEVRAC
jgi:hypothetical protein